MDTFKSTFIKGEVIQFKIFLCELVHQAIEMFSDINEYTITFKNNNCISEIKLGEFESETGISDIALFTCQQIKNCIIGPPEYCSITNTGVLNMYTFNNVFSQTGLTPQASSQREIDMIIELIYSGGYSPTVKTSYKVVKSNNKITKF